jgi:hypothetical protein
MRDFLPVFLCLSVITTIIPTIEDWQAQKIKPDHIGIAEELIKYELSYKTLALLHNIKFTNSVSIGFSVIKMKKGTKKVVGVCNYGKNFREIDIDIAYWNANSEITRRTLLYHEITHCLCGRDHDYGAGDKYPDVDTAVGALVTIIRQPFYKIPPGYMDDRCPMSIMHPYILSDECAIKHREVYDNEMFNRCIPY